MNKDPFHLLVYSQVREALLYTHSDLSNSATLHEAEAALFCCYVRVFTSFWSHV